MNKFAVITAGRERGGGGESIAENPAERRAVADDLRRAMVAAAEFGISRIGTCPLNDGADTLFELDYARAYDSAAETFGAACAHNPAITDRIDSAKLEAFLAERNSANALPYLYSLLCDALHFLPTAIGGICAAPPCRARASCGEASAPKFGLDVTMS